MWCENCALVPCDGSHKPLSPPLPFSATQLWEKQKISLTVTQKHNPAEFNPQKEKENHVDSLSDVAVHIKEKSTESTVNTSKQNQLPKQHSETLRLASSWKSPGTCWHFLPCQFVLLAGHCSREQSKLWNIQVYTEAVCNFISCKLIRSYSTWLQHCGSLETDIPGSFFSHTACPTQNLPVTYWATYFTLSLVKNIPLKSDGINQLHCLTPLTLNLEFSANYKGEDCWFPQRGRKPKMPSFVEAALPWVHLQQVHVMVAAQVNSWMKWGSCSELLLQSRCKHLHSTAATAQCGTGRCFIQLCPRVAAARSEKSNSCTTPESLTLLIRKLAPLSCFFAAGHHSTLVKAESKTKERLINTHTYPSPIFILLKEPPQHFRSWNV